MTANAILKWAYHNAGGDPVEASAWLAKRCSEAEAGLCHSYLQTKFRNGAKYVANDMPAVDDGDAWVDTGKDDTSKAVAS